MKDIEFVRSCTRGDKRQWGAFVNKYSRLIYNYIYAVLQAKGASQFSQEDVEDLFQEIHFSLVKNNFKKLRSFKGKNGSTLASWLRQVVVNHTLDYWRRIKPMVSLDAEDEQGLSRKGVLEQVGPYVNETLAVKERLWLLKDCIQRLGLEEKYFLRLHVHQGIDLERVRRHLRLTRGAIYMRKARIINRLKDCFEQKGLVLDAAGSSY